MVGTEVDKKRIIGVWFKNISLVIVPVGVFMLASSIVSLFIDSNKKQLIYIISLIAAVLLILAVFIIRYLLVKKQTKKGRYDDLADAFVEDFDKMYKDKKSSFDRSMLAEFGSTMAKNLYLSSCYSQRLNIAKKVLTIAKELNDNVLIARTLVYDIGWTEALFNHISAAKTNILMGLEYIKNDDSESAILVKAKGYRYLGSIAVVDKNAQEANKYFKKAKNYCDKITDKVTQVRFEAGIYFAMAEMNLYIKQSRESFDKSLECALKAEKLRNQFGGGDRGVRSYAQIGKIRYFALTTGYGLTKYPNDNYAAIAEFFKTGYEKSIETMRIDEIKKNSYGLACALLRDNPNNLRKAKSIIAEFSKNYGDIELLETDDELAYDYHRLLDRK